MQVVASPPPQRLKVLTIARFCAAHCIKIDVKYMRCGGLNPFGLGLGTVVGSRERDNEQLGSIKG
jgi:hypothetical protein